MTTRLSTTVKNVNSMVTNPENAKLVLKFYEFMKKSGTSACYQNNNLKLIIAFSIFIGPSILLAEIKTKAQIHSFLDTKIKSSENDPDKRWITTWNDYLGRIKFFYRWLHNTKESELDGNELSDWETPDFVRIKKKKTKRISPYLESELWEKDDLLDIIKYEPHKRNKAVLSLLWDLDANNPFLAFTFGI